MWPNDEAGSLSHAVFAHSEEMIVPLGLVTSQSTKLWNCARINLGVLDAVVHMQNVSCTQAVEIRSPS